MERWSLSLDSWIVQDGNYPDLMRGQDAEFAVEVYFLEPPTLSQGSAPTAGWIDETSYEICGLVSAVVEGAWALDFGIAAYEDRQVPAGITVGDTVRGRANLGVDPFFYFERLHAVVGMPPLVYSWRIDEIWRQTAPFVRSAGVLIRDPSKLGWMPVDRTDAWHDDDGHACYRLDCALRAVPPKRSSTTAT